MKRLDGDDSETYVKALFYGRPGTGKTNMVTSAENPLILTTQRQGMVHIREACARLGKPVPPVVYIETLGELRAFVRACRGDKSKPFRAMQKVMEGDTEKTIELLTLEKWPDTLGIDCFTDVGLMVTQDIDRRSPPKLGADNLPAHTQNYWGVLGTTIGNIIRDFRDLPINVAITCLSDDKEIGEGSAKTRYLGPSLPMRRLADEIAAAVNVVGYTYRRAKRGEGNKTKVIYGVLTVGPEYAITKPFRPLRDAEVPDFAYWCGVIRGAQKLREAPPPPEELDSGDAPTTSPGTSEDAPEQRQQAKKTVQYPDFDGAREDCPAEEPKTEKPKKAKKAAHNG